jgi:single-strand DNA-binding protein
MLKTFVIGHLGKDAVVNHVNSKTVINFTVAHTEKYKGQDGSNHEKTTWVDASYWTDRTAVAPYLQKGTQVFVEGTPEVRTFQRNDGTTGASFALRVHNIQLLGSKKEQAAPAYSGNTSQSNTPASMSNMEVADDLPF